MHLEKHFGETVGVIGLEGQKKGRALSSAEVQQGGEGEAIAIAFESDLGAL
ncbi:hypothetical protein [Parasedimentitalea maritima]|uniref:Uncharacterized protein n=1 Tax=Parasedimentitalea maritima TaxID=2578117 RepID=A0A6A4RNH7_9RHOB|nr:hypothetical protein [Zongyanglinia marina]KAE9631699.1 hypothetical protein GP644_05155 [Zongyanglinia marina]